MRVDFGLCETVRNDAALCASDGKDFSLFTSGLLWTSGCCGFSSLIGLSLDPASLDSVTCSSLTSSLFLLLLPVDELRCFVVVGVDFLAPGVHAGDVTCFPPPPPANGLALGLLKRSTTLALASLLSFLPRDKSFVAAGLLVAADFGVDAAAERGGLCAAAAATGLACLFSALASDECELCEDLLLVTQLH